MKILFNFFALFAISFFINSISHGVTCKERVTNVYQARVNVKNIKKVITFDDFFHGRENEKLAKMYDQASKNYRNFYDSMTPRFEEAHQFVAPDNGKVTGYIIQIGVGADEGSGVFTFDSNGEILFGKTIDQSPEYRYLCNKN